MKNSREASIKWESFDSHDEMEASDVALILAARKALSKVHAPYSKFQVGAALLLGNGQIVSGGNFENAAYTMCLCAERTALASAASMYPGEVVKKIAVTVKNPAKPVSQPASPCGACRQVMLEVELKQGEKMEVFMQGESGPVYKLDSARVLLPFGFDGSLL